MGQSSSDLLVKLIEITVKTAVKDALVEQISQNTELKKELKDIKRLVAGMIKENRNLLEALQGQSKSVLSEKKSQSPISIDTGKFRNMYKNAMENDDEWRTMNTFNNDHVFGFNSEVPKPKPRLNIPGLNIETGVDQLKDVDVDLQSLINLGIGFQDERFKVEE